MRGQTKMDCERVGLKRFYRFRTAYHLSVIAMQHLRDLTRQYIDACGGGEVDMLSNTKRGLDHSCTSAMNITNFKTQDTH